MNYYLFDARNIPGYDGKEPFIFSSNGRKYRYKSNPKNLRYSGKVIHSLDSLFEDGDRAEPIAKFCRKLKKHEYVVFKLTGKL